MYDGMNNLRSAGESSHRELLLASCQKQSDIDRRPSENQNPISPNLCQNKREGGRRREESKHAKKKQSL